MRTDTRSPDVWFDRGHPPVGSPPGTLSAPEDAAPSRLRALRYGPESPSEHTTASIDEIAGLLRGEGKLWIELEGLADSALIVELGELVGLHPLALEDVVNVPHRPSFQGFPEHFVLIAQGVDPSSHSHRLVLEQVSLVVGKAFLWSIKEHDNAILDTLRRRLENPAGRIRQLGPDYLSYAILDTIVDSYFPYLEEIGEALEELEDRVVAAPQPEQLAEINRLKKALLTLRRALWPLREAISQLVRDRPPQLSEPVTVFVRDCYDHCVQLLEIIEASRELATNLTSTYLSAVGNRTNEVMKVLTIMASIFIPLTFLAGIYGMNFEHMPELGWRWSYPLLLVAMAGAVVVMLLYFKRLGWLRRERVRTEDRDAGE